MINPHLLRAGSKRWNNPRFAGGKFYLAVLLPAALRARRVFKRASDAETYAERIIVRWRRLYDAMIVEMIAPSQEA